MKKGECISQNESRGVFDFRQREKLFSFSPLTALSPPGPQWVMQGGESPSTGMYVENSFIEGRDSGHTAGTLRHQCYFSISLLFPKRGWHMQTSEHEKKKRNWPKGYRGELLTERLSGQSSNRQDKLGWGRETTTEVPLSKALNPHLLW